MELDELARQVQRTWAGGGRRVTALPYELDVGVGLEQRTVRDRYDWYGLRRGDHPYAVIQYGLAGWGAYTDASGKTTRIDPGMCFFALIPSDHRYFLHRAPAVDAGTLSPQPASRPCRAGRRSQ